MTRWRRWCAWMLTMCVCTSFIVLYRVPAFSEGIEEDPQTAVEPAPTSAPEPMEIPTPKPTVEPTVVPTAEPTVMPTSEPTETPTQIPTATPTAEPTAVPIAEPTEAPSPETTDEPTVEPIEASAEASSEVPEAPFEQSVQIGELIVSVSAPAGVFAPDTVLTIRETNSEPFKQAILSTDRVAGDVVRHSMISISGAEMNGSAQVKIVEPLIVEMDEQYPAADIKVSVYAYLPEAVRLTDQTKQIVAAMRQDTVTFNISSMTVIDVVIAVVLPENTIITVEEPAVENSVDSLEETPEQNTEAQVDDELVIDISTEIVDDLPAIAPAEETAGELADAEKAMERPLETASTDEDNAEKPMCDVPAEADAEESVDEKHIDEDPESEAFAVTIQPFYEGELQYGTTVTLNAILPFDTPNAIIFWQYSPDGGKTILNAEEEHSSTLVYTFSEANEHYIWRVMVKTVQ